MEYKRAGSFIDRTTTGRENEDDYLHKIIIAAATTLAMACLKRILVMFFDEQWRARVFLILNLVLVAIFISSICSSSSENEEVEGNYNADMIKDEEKKKGKEGAVSNSTEDNKESKKAHIGKQVEKDGLEIGEEEEQCKGGDQSSNLSKEELNERVEAFIAMFRQHLVTDARKGKSHFISTSRPSKFTNSSGPVPYRHSFCI